MGYAVAFSPCVSCGHPFTYNPLKVPSVTIPKSQGGTGTREPICEACVARVNPIRVANGLAPIVPAPGAYDACDESEI